MLGFICSLYAVGQFIKEAFEPTLPAEYHGNLTLENADANKVRLGQMSRRQFNRNIKNGKYYAPISKMPPLSESDRLIQQANQMSLFHPVIYKISIANITKIGSIPHFVQTPKSASKQ